MMAEQPALSRRPTPPLLVVEGDRSEAPPASSLGEQIGIITGAILTKLMR